MTDNLQGKWALILGASSGHGGAVALELARKGVNIFGVHLDLRSTLANAQRVIADIEAQGVQAIFYNSNAADDAKRNSVLDQIRERLPQGEHLRVLLHSLAFGSLKPYTPENREEAVTRANMEMTLDVMAHSLVYWTQDALYRGLLGPGSKIFSMTSSGSHRVFASYGPVGCAKAALEYHTKHLAVELSARGVAVNAIQAGVTDTPALRKIPGNERMLEFGVKHNPGGRVTTPEDVAAAIATLAAHEGAWLTGNVIVVDGGEDLVMM